MVGLLIDLLVLVITLVIMYGLIVNAFFEVRGNKWHKAGMYKPSYRKAGNGNEKRFRVLVSTVSNEVLMATYDVDEDGYDVKDVEAFRYLPPYYGRALKMYKGLIAKWKKK